MKTYARIAIALLTTSAALGRATAADPADIVVVTAERVATQAIEEVAAVAMDEARRAFEQLLAALSTERPSPEPVPEPQPAGR